MSLHQYFLGEKLLRNQLQPELDAMTCTLKQDSLEIDQQIWLSEQIQMVFKNHQTQPDSVITMPSVCGLSNVFHCSQAQVLQALQALKGYGIAYQIHGLDSPITMHESVENEKRNPIWAAFIKHQHKRAQNRYLTAS